MSSLKAKKLLDTLGSTLEKLVNRKIYHVQGVLDTKLGRKLFFRSNFKMN
jgi:hypothetical protein